MTNLQGTARDLEPEGIELPRVVKAGHKIVINWVDNTGDKRTDEAAIS